MQITKISDRKESPTEKIPWKKKLLRLQAVTGKTIGPMSPTQLTVITLLSSTTFLSSITFLSTSFLFAGAISGRPQAVRSFRARPVARTHQDICIVFFSDTRLRFLLQRPWYPSSASASLYRAWNSKCSPFNWSSQPHQPQTLANPNDVDAQDLPATCRQTRSLVCAWCQTNMLEAHRYLRQGRMLQGQALSCCCPHLDVESQCAQQPNGRDSPRMRAEPPARTDRLIFTLHIHICIRIYRYIYIYVYTYTYMYMYNICIYMYMYVYI